MGLFLDPGGQVEAVHLGHVRVGQHQAERASLEAGLLEGQKGGLGAVDGHRPHPPMGQHFVEDPPVRGVVVHDEDRQVLQVRETERRDRFPFLVMKAERNGEEERAAAADLAFDLKLSLHQGDELGGNRQAQPGPAEHPGGGRVRLGEGLENKALLLRRDPDAGVLDLDAEPDLFVGPPGHVDGNDDFTLVRELDGVAQEVGQDLPEPARVADQPVGDGARDRIGQLDGLPFGQEGDAGHGRVDRVPEVERDFLHLDLLGLDFREVENVVDDRHERIGRRLDRFHVLALVGGEIGFESQLGHAENAVHRRPDLVAHVGQEFALGPVGLAGLALGLFQFGRPFLDFLLQLDRPAVDVADALADCPIDRQAGQQGGQRLNPADHIERRNDPEMDRRPLFVPNAVVVGGFHPEDITAGIEIHVAHEPAALDFLPAGVEALHDIGVTVLFRRDVMEGGELEGDDPVAEPEVDIGRFGDRFFKEDPAVHLAADGDRLVEDLEIGDDDLGPVGIVLEVGREEGAEPAGSAEEHFPRFRPVPRSAVELIALESVGDVVCFQSPRLGVPPGQAPVAGNPDRVLLVDEDAVDRVVRKAVLLLGVALERPVGRIEEIQAGRGPDPQPSPGILGHVGDEIAAKGGRGLGRVLPPDGEAAGLAVEAVQPAAERPDPQGSGVIEEKGADLVVA